MGSTLDEGIYLPSEGETNCYSGLASNWQKVNSALGDVAELKQLIESKFTKEIVTELPTEDINPYCIYMILKTDPETNNIYDEWVYINNAWEYLGNTRVDMTQYYTKQEVNQLPAVASGVTSTKVGNYDTHLADTNIHVTASDKEKWNTLALIKHLRLVNAQVGSATTIPFSDFDDTNGIKVGDKCADLDVKVFEITAVDTANQTVTVTPLIDIALDANVVHTSGNETINGIKSFTSVINMTPNGIGTHGCVIKVPFSRGDTENTEGSVLTSTNHATFRVVDKNSNIISETCTENYVDGKVAQIFNVRNTNDNGNQVQSSISHLLDKNAEQDWFYPTRNNKVMLGTSTCAWKSVYATNYYYGNIEFSDKFVTTDTAQTVGGKKLFSTFITSNGSRTQDEYSTNARTNLWLMSNKDTEEVSGILFDTYRQNTAQGTGIHILGIGIKENGVRYEGCRFGWYWDNNLNGYYLDFKPNMQGAYQAVKHNLGTSVDKWDTINGVEPSALGMPDLDNAIDISGYITNFGGGTVNEYTPVSNGWISIADSGDSPIFIRVYNDYGFEQVAYSERNEVGGGSGGTYSRFGSIMIPCVKDVKIYIIVSPSTSVLVSAKFFPCQGNV